MMDHATSWRPIKLLVRAWADTRGASAVEMALILPVLLLFLFGTFEFARYSYIRGQIEYAVELTMREGMVSNPACTSVNMEALVTDSSRLIGIPAADVTVTASVESNTGASSTLVPTTPQSCKIDARYAFSFFGFVDLTTLAIQAIGSYPCRSGSGSTVTDICST